MNFLIFQNKWATEIPNLGIPIVLDSLLVAVLLGRYRSPRFLFFWSLLSRILTYPLFYLLGFVIFAAARTPFLEMFLRHALSGISGFILAEALTVIAAGYLLRFYRVFQPNQFRN